VHMHAQQPVLDKRNTVSLTEPSASAVAT
jgi:hypothetical protein